MLTFGTAKAHLLAVQALAVERNRFLACVHAYLRNVELDVVVITRADTFKSYEDIRDLSILEKETQDIVSKFLVGV